MARSVFSGQAAEGAAHTQSKPHEYGASGYGGWPIVSYLCPPRPPSSPTHQSANLLLLVRGFGFSSRQAVCSSVQNTTMCPSVGFTVVLAQCGKQGFRLWLLWGEKARSH